MLVSEIIDNIQVNLNEAGLTYYTEVDILEAIQDGYDEIVTLTGCIEKYTYHPQINDLVYYRFGDSISDFYAIVGIYNSNTKRWLYPRTLIEARSMRWDWELWDGEPDNFIISSYKLTAIFPSKLAAIGSFLIFYNALADSLTTGSTPKLPIKHMNVLENYATASLLEQAQEYIRASKYLKEYVESISKVKDAAKLLAATDRLMIMGDSMPRFAEGVGDSEMWVDFETPTVVTPASLTIAGVPSPSTAFYLFRDAGVLFEGIGFTRVGNTISLNAGYEDVSGVTVWRASYRTA